MRLYARLGPVVLLLTTGCSCESDCDRERDRFARVMSERLGELARLSSSAPRIHADLPGGRPVETSSRVWVTGSGIHYDLVACVDAEYRAYTASMLARCESHGSWPLADPPPLAPLDEPGFRSAIGGLPPLLVMCTDEPALIVSPGADADALRTAVDVADENVSAIELDTPRGSRRFDYYAQVVTPAELARHRSSLYPPEMSLELELELDEAGIHVRASGGVLAPGCETTTALDEPAVPRVGERYDWRALQRCLTKLKAEFPHESELALVGSHATAAEIAVALAAVGTDGRGELFPMVWWVVEPQ